MRTQVTKARLEAKVNLDIYELLKQAAAITGRTLTDFVVSVAYYKRLGFIEFKNLKKTHRKLFYPLT